MSSIAPALTTRASRLRQRAALAAVPLVLASVGVVGTASSATAATIDPVLAASDYDTADRKTADTWVYYDRIANVLTTNTHVVSHRNYKAARNQTTVTFKDTWGNTLWTSVHDSTACAVKDFTCDSDVHRKYEDYPPYDVQLYASSVEVTNWLR